MAVNWTLRPATRQDIPFLLELRRLTMRPYLERDGVVCSDEDDLHRVLHRFEDARIIEVDGQAAGLFKASFLADRNQWRLFQIQIHPDFQNAGIGGSVVRWLMSKARRDGSCVGLGVLRSNPARRLYRKLGFKVVDRGDSEIEMLFEG